MGKFKSSLKYIIPLVLAVILIWYVFSSIDINKLWGRIASAKLSWVFTAIFISLLAHVSRAYRWNLLLEPLGFKPSLKNTFIAVMVGYFGNIFLPRGGEVMRCMVLTKVNDIPFSSSFGTVVAERAFDFLCLMFLIACALILEFERFNHFLSEFILNKKDNPQTPALYQNYLFIGMALFSFAVLFIIVFFKKQIFKSVLYLKVKSFVIGIIQGVLSIGHLKRKWEFILHTILIWVGYYLMTYLMFFSLPATAHLDLTAGLVILIVGGLGMSAPVSGGIGPFHIMVAGALQLFYGLSQDDGVAFAFVIHTSQLISLLFVGGISSVYVLIATRKKTVTYVEDQR